jgi:hypothetical protein
MIYQLVAFAVHGLLAGGLGEIRPGAIALLAIVSHWTFNVSYYYAARHLFPDVDVSGPRLQLHAAQRLRAGGGGAGDRDRRPLVREG